MSLVNCGRYLNHPENEGDGSCTLLFLPTHCAYYLFVINYVEVLYHNCDALLHNAILSYNSGTRNWGLGKFDKIVELTYFHFHFRPIAIHMKWWWWLPSELPQKVKYPSSPTNLVTLQMNFLALNPSTSQTFPIEEQWVPFRSEQPTRGPRSFERVLHLQFSQKERRLGGFACGNLWIRELNMFTTAVPSSSSSFLH